MLGITHHTGVRLAEISFLFLMIGGAWLAFSHIPQLKLAGVRTTVAGILLAVAGLLLLIATHWGHFG